MIDRVTIDKIMDAANIVDVVSDFVTLRRAGANLKGLCPFHDDRTPSFMVSPAKNYCKCFACGKGGNPVGFIMEHEQLSYPEALRYLARKYGIPIEEKELTPEEKQSQGDRESMFIVNEWARDWFRHQLHDTDDGMAIGMAYFHGRGFRDDIIERFQLGYCPDNRSHSMAEDALKAGYQEKYLINTIDEHDPKNSVGTGLCIKNEHGTWRDRFRGRVIWPIFSMSGRVAGFGGRVLDAATKGVNVKYLNSPESVVYSKRKELFGLFQAKEAIRRQDLCYLVEGYTDVMAMHQMGVENVVASSGTALTTDQIRLIHRMTSNITVIFDGDEAGIHASERGIDMLLAEGMDVKLLLLPDGDDPDSFARKHSSEELRKYIDENQTDFITFKTRQLLENVTDPIKRGEAISDIARSISVIPDQVIRDTFVTDCAHRIGLDESTLVNTINKYIRRAKEEKQKERERAEKRNGTELEQNSGSEEEDNSRPIIPLSILSSQEQANEVELLLIQEIVRHGSEVIFDNVETNDGQTITLTVAQYISLDLGQDDLQFFNPLHQQILNEAAEHSGDAGWKSESYFCSHPDQQVSQLATRLAIDRHQLGGRFVLQPRENALQQRVRHLVMDFRLGIIKQRLKDIERQMRQPSKDSGKTMELMRQYKDTKEIRDALAKQLGRDLVV